MKMSPNALARDKPVEKWTHESRSGRVRHDCTKPVTIPQNNVTYALSSGHQSDDK